jgi:hypothetical protein
MKKALAFVTVVIAPMIIAAGIPGTVPQSNPPAAGSQPAPPPLGISGCTGRATRSRRRRGTRNGAGQWPEECAGIQRHIYAGSGSRQLQCSRLAS